MILYRIILAYYIISYHTVRVWVSRCFRVPSRPTPTPTATISLFFVSVPDMYAYDVMRWMEQSIFTEPGVHPSFFQETYPDPAPHHPSLPKGLSDLEASTLMFLKGRVAERGRAKPLPSVRGLWRLLWCVCRSVCWGVGWVGLGWVGMG